MFLVSCHYLLSHLISHASLAPFTLIIKCYDNIFQRLLLWEIVETEFVGEYRIQSTFQPGPGMSRPTLPSLSISEGSKIGLTGTRSEWAHKEIILSTWINQPNTQHINVNLPIQNTRRFIHFHVPYCTMLWYWDTFKRIKGTATPTSEFRIKLLHTLLGLLSWKN